MINKTEKIGYVGFVFYPDGWNAEQTYHKMSLVVANQTMYLAIKESTGVNPRTDMAHEYWQAFLDNSATYSAAIAAEAAAVKANDASVSANEATARAKETIDNMIARIQESISATASANLAADGANSAASSANIAADRAKELNSQSEILISDTQKALDDAVKIESDANLLIARVEQSETERVNAENTRVSNEQLRNDAEQSRDLNEDKRKEAERNREDKEAKRNAEEQSRKEAESARVLAENARENSLNDAVKKAKSATDAANTAANTANASAKSADVATAGAERVNATIADDVFTVTGRDGNVTTLPLADADAIKKAVDGVKRINDALGAYSDRPSIELKAQETGVAISADGVKVSKSGWAIAEFVAEKGNEYLFKPNLTDGDVSIFAEKIDRAEKRSIEYNYTYNDDGSVATAEATYLGKTHRYTYEYTEGETSPVIKDENGVSISELPYQYQTTVGSYSPLIHLNAGAELPTDGYCRFMSHFQGNSSLNVVVSYKIGVADLTMKVLRDGVFANISSQLGTISQKENETRALVVDLKEKVEQFVETNPYVGFARMNGDASGDAEVAFGDKALMHEVGSEWKLATVKNGEVTHVMAAGRLTLDENGEEVKIDGSDGDVMLINRSVNLLRGSKVIDGREMNVLAIGKKPALWYGIESKRMPAFGMTPCETVNGKIFDDKVSQAHCVYNTELKGGYSKPKGIAIKESYVKDGGGYFSYAVSCVNSIQQAQRKNEDPLTSYPYMGWYYETYEALLATMFAEIGSLRHTDLNMFGVGGTTNATTEATFNDETISGNSGWKFFAKNGENYYSYLVASVTAQGTNTSMLSEINGYQYQFIQMLEGQRVLDAISKNNMTDRIGTKDNIFYFNEEGALQIASSDEVNLSTGDGMELLRFYYIVRNIPKCEGIADGVMTALVNRYVKVEIGDNVQITNRNVDISNSIAIMKVSLPIYRGFTLPYTSAFRQMSGAYYFIHQDSEDNVSIEFRSCDGMDKVKPLTNFGSTSYYKPLGEVPELGNGLSNIYKYKVNPPYSSYVKSSNYEHSLFCFKEIGGGFRTYENCHVWNPAGYLSGKNSTCAHGSVVGCFAVVSGASARSLLCNDPAGFDYGAFAGAFAVLLAK